MKGNIIASLYEQAKDPVATFGLTDSQHAKARVARHAAPDGFLAVVDRCREYGAARGNTGAGLLMFLLDKGEHFAAQLAIDAGDPLGFYSNGTHWHGWVPETEEDHRRRLAGGSGDRDRVLDADPPADRSPVETHVGEIVRRAGIKRLEQERDDVLRGLSGNRRSVTEKAELKAIDDAIGVLRAMAWGESDS